jgi:adenylate cyclase class 2
MNPNAPNEIEVKIEIPGAESAVQSLITAGAQLVSPRELEDNVLLDLDDARLARSGKLLRIRRIGPKSILTVKSPPETGSTKYKIRRETEVEVADARQALRALEDLGFRPSWRYQKWRQTYSFQGVTVVVDELPWGAYLEIEGDPVGIDRAASALGYGPQDYETASYREIHERHCRAAGVPVGDLLFAGATEGIS